MQSVVLFCFLLIQSAFAKNPFRVEISPVSTPSGVSSEIVVTFVIPKDHHMYQDMMSVTPIDKAGLTIGEASFPTGKFKPDPADPSQNREVFDKSIQVKVPVTGSKKGQYKPQFTVSYQGCKKSLCYMPVNEKHSVPVQITPKQKASPQETPAKGSLQPEKLEKSKDAVVKVSKPISEHPLTMKIIDAPMVLWVFRLIWKTNGTSMLLLILSVFIYQWMRRN